MAITNKRSRSDLLLGNALRNGNSITRPTDINISKPIITPTTKTTQNNIAPNAVGVPSEAYAHANGTYEPQLLTPVESKAEQLVDLANQNYAKEYEDREGANLSNSEEANNSPSEKDKIDEQLQQGYSDHYEELDDSNKNNVPATDVKEPKAEEPTNANNNSINYDTDDNPYKSRVDELQAVIDQINADNEAKAKEIEAQKKAYEELKNNSIDLLKGNNDEAWKEQKNRIKQSALNYKSELDAINKKSSMYYDDYLEMLGLKGSGAGAGLYNDMAVQNANAAMQIEANRQNEIENARQANTDRLMALLDEARASGITLNDEEMKDILGTYSKDSLAAGTDTEATRWNRFSNLATAKKEQDEAEAKAQAELDNKDKVIANFASSMLEQGYTAEQVREAIKQFDDIVDESGKDSRTPTQRLLDATKVLEGTQEEQSQTGGKDELTLPEKQTQLANMKTVAKEQPDEFKAAITYYGTSLGSNPNTATGNTVNTALDVVKNSQKMYTNAELMGSDLAEQFFYQNAITDIVLSSGQKIPNQKLTDIKTYEEETPGGLKVQKTDENYGKNKAKEEFAKVKPILEEAFKAAKNGKLPDGTTIIPKRDKNDNYGVAYTYIGGYWYVGKCAWNADGVMTKEQLEKVIQ